MIEYIEILEFLYAMVSVLSCMFPIMTELTFKKAFISYYMNLIFMILFT